jgi:hypothetical protein
MTELQRAKLKPKALPKAMAKPVESRGQSTDTGYRMENYSWFPWLTRRVGDRLEGRDPKSIPANILSGSGHPPRSATNRIRAYLRWLDVERDPKRDKGLKRLRELCLSCANTAREVRVCACIDCPLWAHRMGTNPHNHHKRMERLT